MSAKGLMTLVTLGAWVSGALIRQLHREDGTLMTTDMVPARSVAGVR